MKFRIIALVAFAGILWACHKPAEDPYADAPWAIDETLPVPITFKANELFSIDTDTKGVPITNVGVGANWNGTTLTIFGAELDPSDPLTGFNDERVLLDRVSAYVDGTNVQFTNGNADITRYYPMLSVDDPHYNYSFIGYHTPTVNGYGIISNSTIRPAANGHPYVTFTMSPQSNEDVLWARADAEDFEYETDTYEGFNAVYQRKARLKWGASADFTAHLPNLGFTHQAALLQFKVKAADAQALATFWDGAVGSGTPLVTVGTLKVRVKTPYARLDLYDGTLEVNEFRSGGYISATDYSYESSDITPTGYTTETATQYGTGLFVLPGTRTSSSDVTPGDPFTAPVVTFTITNTDDGSTLTPSFELKVPSGGYEAGKVYTYYISVNSIESMQLHATLAEEWDDGTFDNPSTDPIIDVG